MATIDSSISGIRTVKASEFKAKCLQLMDEVAESGEEIVITKFGKPVAKLAPHMEKPRAPFGAYKGQIQILGDIVSPMPAEWFQEPNAPEKDLF